MYRVTRRLLAYVFLLGLLVALGGSYCATDAQTITSVSMLTDPEQTGSYVHGLTIAGTGFNQIGANGTAVGLVVVPNAGVSDVTAVITSDTAISGRFTASNDYELSSVVLTRPAPAPAITFAVPPATCKPSDVLYQYQIASDKLASDTFGNGLARNFFAVQLSVINKCQLKIVIPIAGIQIFPEWDQGTTAKAQYAPPGAQRKEENQSVTQETGTQEAGTEQTSIAPYGLDHVITVYNTYQTLTGRRAILLNAMQAATTIGSAVQPFLAPGFTQGVAIFGGAFRNAVLEVFKDMSPQQLKSLSSETFQTSEVISPTGSVGIQKFIFVPKSVVTLPPSVEGKKKYLQRIIGIKSIQLTWSVANNTTQTSTAQPKGN